MPTIFPTKTSPPPEEASMSMTAPSPPPPAPSAPSQTTGVAQGQHQVGARQATRSRTRTRHAQPTQTQGHAGPSRITMPRHHSEDHPLSAQKLAARGYHSFQCLGVPFRVKRRYTFVRELGIGAYGCVALAHDSVLDCNVAIKKVTRVFEREVLARRALREVAVLRHIGLCDNVTALLDFDTSFVEFNEIYLVLEASEADLSQIIRSGQALSDAHLQYFMAQILRGLRYMHTAKIIHRDLKPGNLLVNGDCHLKLCDFGLARAYRDLASTPPLAENNSSDDAERAFPDSPRVDRSQPPSPSLQLSQSAPSHLKTTALDFPGGPLTEYVATRWYRAPEIMLCFRKGYDQSIDVWSVGCILAELLGGKPIFAGKDYVDQIARINNVLGSPTQSTIDKIGSERARTYVESLPPMPAVPFDKLYPKASPLAIDLLSKMLVWDPEQRMSASEALQHPWLKAYHRSNGSWDPPSPFARFDEVEMLSSMGDFRGGLERESDEMRAEIEALEAEESQLMSDDSSRQSRENSSSEPDQDVRDHCDEQHDHGDPEHRHRRRESGSEHKSEEHRGRANASSRSADSDVGSPMATPMTFTSSVNEASPNYETDLTSASAPHSVSGSHSAGKRMRAAFDGLGLMSQVGSDADVAPGNTKRDRASRQALDETLANHGLLRGDDTTHVERAHSGRSTFRRRALSNAPSQAMCLRRHGSDGNLRQLLCELSSGSGATTTPGPASASARFNTATSPESVQAGQASSDSAPATAIPSTLSSSTSPVHEALHNISKTTDIIRRPVTQRERHAGIADEASELLRWLWASSSPWVPQRLNPFSSGVASIPSGDEAGDVTATEPPRH